jgi:hypothetical protein
MAAETLGDHIASYYKDIQDNFGEEALTLSKSIISSFAKNGISSSYSPRPGIEFTDDIAIDLAKKVKQGMLRFNRKEKLFMYKNTLGEECKLSEEDILMRKICDLTIIYHNNLSPKNYTQKQIDSASEVDHLKMIRAISLVCNWVNYRLG